MNRNVTLALFRDLDIGQHFFLAGDDQEYKKVSGSQYMRLSGGACHREPRQAVLVVMDRSVVSRG
jgi:hypothetical protein